MLAVAAAVANVTDRPGLIMTRPLQAMLLISMGGGNAPKAIFSGWQKLQIRDGPMSDFYQIAPKPEWSV